VFVVNTVIHISTDDQSRSRRLMTATSATHEQPTGHRKDYLSLVLVQKLTAGTQDRDVERCVGRDHDEEAQRAGFIALGMAFLAAAIVSVRVPVPLTVALMFGAVLCFLQLSVTTRRWIGMNWLTRAGLTFRCWMTRLPFGLRVSLLVTYTLAGLALLLTAPFAPPLGKFVANVLMCVGLILLVGPKAGENKNKFEQCC